MPDIYDLIVKERRNLQPEQLAWRGIQDRSVAQEYAKLETLLMESFRKGLSSPSQVEVDGFVTRVGGGRLIIRPSLATNYGVLCDATALRILPADHEFVRVKCFRKLSSRAINRFADGELQLTHYEPIRLPTEYLKPDISMNDAAEVLFNNYVDVDTVTKVDLLLSLTSSPGDHYRIGGLSSTLLPSENEYTSSLKGLLQDIKKSIPIDLTTESKVMVSLAGLAKTYEITPFLWNMYSTSVSVGAPPVDKIFARTPSQSVSQELTIGVSTNSIAPKSLEELWIRCTDFPLIIDQPIQKSGESRGIDLDLVKYLITVHMNSPHLSPDVDENLERLVKSQLGQLKRRYDPDGYGGMIDFDIETGSPRSIIHIAKSLARAGGRDTVDRSVFEEALSQFRDSRKHVFSAWEDRNYKSAVKSVEVKLAYMGKSATKIYRFIKENPSLSKSEIREKFARVEETVFESSMRELRNDGLIYKTSEQDERYSAVES